MTLQGIHHVSINVSDLVAATEFYTKVLGLELLQRPDLGFEGAWLRAGSQEVHLLGIVSTAPPKEQHFAFAVESLAEIQTSLAKAGVSCSEPFEIPGVCVQAFAQDPSGNLLEFNQRL